MLRYRRHELRKVGYIVSVNSLSEFRFDGDIENALFGDESIIWRRDGTTTSTRRPNGAWGTGKGPHGTRVSAVLAFTSATPWSFQTSRFRLYHHPRAVYPLPLIPSWPQAVCDDTGRLQYVDGATLPELLHLPPGWPCSKL